MTKLENSKPTDIDGLKKQMLIDALTEMIKWCDDKSNNMSDLDQLTERNKQRATYLRSIK